MLQPVDETDHVITHWGAVDTIDKTTSLKSGILGLEGEMYQSVITVSLACCRTVKHTYKSFTICAKNSITKFMLDYLINDNRSFNISLK